MTSENVGQPEQTQTHRKVPLDEAQQLIMAQIEKGEDLLNQAKSIQSKKQLRATRDEYTNWRKYTADLLKRKIFDTDELANEFAPQFDEYGWLFAPDTPIALQDDLDRDRLRLRSIYERLEFYPERAPQPTPTEDEAGKKRGPTARTQIRAEVSKRLKDAHPEWTQEKLATLFISYSRKDSEFAHRLAGDLRTARYSVWVDVGGLRGGQEWVREIDKAIRTCDAFVLVISPDSMTSKWVSKETLLAISLKKLIVPIMWRETERPVHLVDIQYVDFQGAYDDAMQELYEALSPATFSPTSNPSPPSSTPNLPKCKSLPSSC